MKTIKLMTTILATTLLNSSVGNYQTSSQVMGESDPIDLESGNEPFYFDYRLRSILKDDVETDAPNVYTGFSINEVKSISDSRLKSGLVIFPRMNCQGKPVVYFDSNSLDQSSDLDLKMVEKGYYRVNTFIEDVRDVEILIKGEELTMTGRTLDGPFEVSYKDKMSFDKSKILFNPKIDAITLDNDSKDLEFRFKLRQRIFLKKKSYQNLVSTLMNL